MRRCLRVILSVAIVLTAYSPMSAQETARDPTPIEYVGVVEVPGVSANDLYVRAKVWFAETFNDSKYVLEVQDKEAGVLAGKGSIPFVPTFLMGRDIIAGPIKFNIKVLVKDGKYKYMLTDFVHYGTTSSVAQAISFGAVTNATEPPSLHNTTKNMREKGWQQIHETISAHALLAIEKLKQVMLAPPGGSGNW